MVSADGLRTPRPEWQLPGALLLLGLVITGVGVWFSHQVSQTSAQRQFDSLAHDAGTTIGRRVATYTEVLYGLRSLSVTSTPLTRENFHRYLALADVQGRNPGAQAITFDRQIMSAQRATFEESITNDKSLGEFGYPSFKVHPETDNEFLYLVDYIQPVKGNEAAFGFDIGSDPLRRSAMEKARDSGAPVATTPIRLVQEKGTSQGFLLLLATYDRSEVPVTAPARRRAFSGVFAAAFRLDDMMAGVLGADPKVNVEIYDIGATVDTQPLPISKQGILFDTNAKADALNPAEAPRPNRFLDINVAERRWRIFATPGPGFSAGSQKAVPFGVGLAGIASTLLVFGLLYSFGRSRRMAIGIATQMTATLRDREGDLKQANVRLDSMNQELQDVNQAMKDFVATAAHDLRSPLTSIVGFAATLTRGWDKISDAQKQQFIDVIERQGRHLSRLVEDLLTLSRLEAGALESDSETVSVKEATDDALEFYSQEFPGIEVGVGDDLMVLVDRTQLRRIIANLVGNAVKYGIAPLRVEARDAGSFVEIKVRDQGEGVPEEFVPRLFSRFSRASTEQTRSVQGTGLGLSIVQGLAHANGGEAWYEPNHPKGACFGVRLPKP